MGLENLKMLTIFHTKYNTEISVLSVFICRYSVFFGIYNTDVGIGIGILKYRGIGIGIPTQL